ncbi:MAG: recombinase family protein [Pseudomonadota bacterium]
METIGYKRVSSSDQNTARQLDGIGIDKLFEEKISGATTERPKLQEMISYVREGDKVVVHEMSRLGRSMIDLTNIVKSILDKGASITFIKEQISFGNGENSAFTNLQFNIMASFSQFEREIIRERQREGIAKAKERGAYEKVGRKKKPVRDKVKELDKAGMGKTEIAKLLNIGRATVYRALAE